MAPVPRLPRVGLLRESRHQSGFFDLLVLGQVLGVPDARRSCRSESCSHVLVEGQSTPGHYRQASAVLSLFMRSDRVRLWAEPQRRSGLTTATVLFRFRNTIKMVTRPTENSGRLRIRSKSHAVAVADPPENVLSP